MFKLEIITLKDTIGSCKLFFSPSLQSPTLRVKYRLHSADTDAVRGTVQTEVTVGTTSPSCTGYSINYICFRMQMNTGVHD